jgi:hypothetical protein
LKNWLHQRRWSEAVSGGCEFLGDKSKGPPPPERPCYLKSRSSRKLRAVDVLGLETLGAPLDLELHFRAFL